MSPHGDPEEVLQSVEQPTSLGGDNIQSDFNPFSIREYVLDSRKKDIFQSWPFPEKYLHMFLNHGIKTVLPPFEPHHLALQSLSGRVQRLKQQKDNVANCDRETHQSSLIDSEKISKQVRSLNKSDETSSEICSQDCHQDQVDCPVISHPCNGEVNVTASVEAKENRGKGKHKEKSIVDLLDVAKPCTSQNLRRRRSRYGLSKTLEHRVTTDKQKSNIEQNCESVLTEDRYLQNKLRVDDCEGAAIDMFCSKKIILEFKFKGRNSLNSRNRSLREKETKVSRLRK